jgi:hypothetical protein
LKDAEGKDERIKVVVKDGKIAERENVELPEGKTEAPKEETQMDSIAGDDIASPISPDASDESTEEIPQTMESLSYRIEELEKLVAEHIISKTKEAEKVKTEPLPGTDPNEPLPGTEKMAAVDGGDDSEETTDEEELPKLDGAPVEDEPKPTHKFNSKKGLVANSQNTFLSKLYK